MADIRAEAQKHFEKGRLFASDGKYDEAAEQFVLAESMFRQIPDPKEAGSARAELAETQRQNGAMEQASVSFERAIEYFHEAGAALQEAQAALSLGHVYRIRGQITGAQEQYTRTVEMFLKLDNTRGAAAAYTAIGHIERLQGHLDAALDAYTNGVAAVASQIDGLRADALRGLGETLKLKGDSDRAAVALEEVLGIYKENYDGFGVADASISLGKIQLDRGEYETAQNLFSDALRKARALEYELAEADAIVGLGKTALAQNDLPQAHALLRRGLEAFGEEKNGLGQGEANAAMGELYLQRSELLQAVTVLERAQRAYKTIKDSSGYADVTLQLAETQLFRSFIRKAEELFTESAKHAQEMNRPHMAARAQLGIAEIQRIRGHNAEAKTAFSEAKNMFQRVGDFAGQGKALVGLARLALNAAQFVEARALLDDAQGRLEIGKYRQAPAELALLRGEIAVSMGQRSVAQQQYSAAEAFSREHALLFLQAEALRRIGELALLNGENSTAVNAFYQSSEISKSSENRAGEYMADALRGKALIARELWQEGVSAIEETYQNLRRYELRWFLCEAYIAAGIGNRGRQERGLAEQSYIEASELAAELDAPLLRLQCYTGLAQLKLDAFEYTAAAERFSQALAIFTSVISGVEHETERAAFTAEYASLFAEALFAAVMAEQEAQIKEISGLFLQYADSGAKTSLQSLLEQLEDSVTAMEKASDEQEEKSRLKLNAKKLGALRKQVRK